MRHSGPLPAVLSAALFFIPFLQAEPEQPVSAFAESMRADLRTLEGRESSAGRDSMREASRSFLEPLRSPGDRSRHGGSPLVPALVREPENWLLRGWKLLSDESLDEEDDQALFGILFGLQPDDGNADGFLALFAENRKTRRLASRRPEVQSPVPEEAFLFEDLLSWSAFRTQSAFGLSVFGLASEEWALPAELGANRVFRYGNQHLVSFHRRSDSLEHERTGSAQPPNPYLDFEVDADANPFIAAWERSGNRVGQPGGAPEARSADDSPAPVVQPSENPPEEEPARLFPLQKRNYFPQLDRF